MPRLSIETFGYDVSNPPGNVAWTIDVRDIPGNVVAGIAQLDGKSKAVQDRVLATSQAKHWISRFERKLPDLKDGDTIAIGCSRGVHRSVALAEEFARIARAQGWDVLIRNLDLGKRDTQRSIESMSTFEVRAIGGDNVSFSVIDGKPAIRARAIIFDSWSEDLGGFRERMMPNSVTLDADMVALFDHDTSMVLGRQSAGTLDVRSAQGGVDFTAYPPETSWAKDLQVSMSRGDIRGCSFRMMVDKDQWYVRDGQVCRDVLSARISELTVTSMPAYSATTAEARSHASELAAQIPADLEERAGLVLTDASEQLIKNALQAVEMASDTLEEVLKQVDPTFVDAEEPCDCGGQDCPGCDCGSGQADPNCQCSDPNCPTCGTQDSVPNDMSGSPMSRETAPGGAPETPRSRTYVQGFGFISSKTNKKES